MKKEDLNIKEIHSVSRKKIINSFLLGISAVFSIFLFFISCKKNDPKEVEALTKKTVTKEYAYNIEGLYSDSARVKAKLSAPQMVRTLSDSPVVEMPKSLEILFYDTTLKVNSKLRANYGIRYIMRNITKLRGNIVVVNLQGDTMQTEEMTWNEVTDKVTSNKFVKVKTKEETILAEGFESDINFTKYVFLQNKRNHQSKTGRIRLFNTS